jgi:hypothetical protein
VFPHTPPEELSRPIADRLQRIKKLRNRVFHHEPVWKHNVLYEYKNVVEVIGYINPVAARLVGSLDCVTASLRPGLPRWMRSRIAAM